MGTGWAKQDKTDYAGGLHIRYPSKVTAHGVGAVWQKPILAKSVRGERTLPKIGEEETVLAREASD